MKNYILYLLKSKIILNNIEKFIKRLKNNKIEILNISYVNKNEINIKIYKKDYDSILKLKTIYEINIIDYNGLIKIKNKILNNKFMITLIVISFSILYLITNTIFSIDVITNDSKMKQILKEELEELGIKKYKFKKDYNTLQNIKSEILTKYRDKLDWIEIESIGTKYIVRYEPRIESDEKINTPSRHIIAKKDCVIKSIDVSSGQIVKNINSYVKKGDIIVSGYVDLNGNIKDTVSANGTILGETWYKVTITYPYKYYESYETGNKKEIYAINLLNKSIELFNLKKYKTKNIEEKIILKNNLLPIKLVKQIQKETKVINQELNEDELIEKEVELSKEKIESKLKAGEYISDYKILNKIKNEDSITLNIFFSVIEDVTDYLEIDEYIDMNE